jgi:hypothetical protein
MFPASSPDIASTIANPVLVWATVKSLQGGPEVIGGGGRLLGGEALNIRIGELRDVPGTVSGRPVTQLGGSVGHARHLPHSVVCISRAWPGELMAANGTQDQAEPGMLKAAAGC